MKNSFLLGKIKKNRFINISDQIFNKFLFFSKKNPEIVSLQNVFLKMMIMDFIIPVLKKSFKGEHILEIGCGLGIHSALLSNFGKVSATDLTKTSIVFGKSVDRDRKRIFDTLATNNIDFRYNNGISLPFENESFDMVFHNSVIEHVPNVNIFNREVYRVLKPGGICICVTGTPSLCRYRFIRNYLFRFPLILIHGLLKASFKTFFSRFSFMKILYAQILKRVWHFYPTDERIKKIVEKNYDFKHQPSSLSNRVIKSMYPKILHFVREPDYNHILMEQISGRNRVSLESLLLQFVQHFKSPWNELIFNITPQTHSQYTLNFKTEIQEWHIKNWVKSFIDESFSVNVVYGYRFQHIFGMTYNWITHIAYPIIRIMSQKLPPWFASEFIILTEKKDQ